MDDLGCRAESESRIKLSATLLGPVWIELSPDRGGSFASRHIFAASLVNGGRSESLCLGSSDVSGEEEVAGEGGRDEIMREYWAGVISETEGSGCIGCGDEQMRGAEGGRTYLVTSLAELGGGHGSEAAGGAAIEACDEQQAAAAAHTYPRPPAIPVT